MGTLGKKPETCQHTANGLSPSVTFTHNPLNNDLHDELAARLVIREHTLPIRGTHAGAIPAISCAGKEMARDVIFPSRTRISEFCWTGATFSLR